MKTKGSSFTREVYQPMTPISRVLLSVRVVTIATAILTMPAAFPQNKAPEPVKAAQAPDKAAAYYNFAMGHLYAEMAAAYGNRGEYVNKAIDHYQAALKLDPSASFLTEELTDLYIQSGQLARAVTEAEALLKTNPDNLDARRVLGRIYARMIGDGNTGKIDEKMLNKSIEQFAIITQKDPKDADSWLTLGRLYRVAHKSPEAENAFKQALAVEPDNDEALTGLAMVYSDLGDTKGASEMLKRAGDKRPDVNTFARLAGFYENMKDYASAANAWKKAIPLAQEPEQHKLKLQLGIDLVAARKYDEALALYLALQKEDPKDVETPWQLAELYRQKGQYDKAHEQLSKAKQLDRTNLDVRYSEVNLLDAEGKTDEAIAALQSMLDDTLKSSPTDAEKARRAQLYERLGMLYRASNKIDKAVAAFREVASIEPEAAASQAAEIIETYLNAHNLKMAQQEADAAIKKFPEDRAVVAEHATVLSALGKTDEAVVEIRGLMKNGEKSRELQIMIAQMYEKAKRFKDEEQALNDAADLSKTKEEKAGVDFARGAMYERMKNYDAAEAAFRRVLEAQPDNAGALNYLGYMLADRNMKLEEAHKLISRAVELDPQNGAYLDSLGWVYFRQNQLDQAEASLRKAIERMSTDPTVHDHLGDVYLKQGKVKEAITQWQASLNEWKNTPPAETDSDEVAKVSRKLENAKTRIARETR
jgi:tetratricopeptide (TPR) repeat protein